MTVLENDGTLATCGSAVHGCFVLCTVYYISIPGSYVRKQLTILVAMLVLSSNITCRKRTASNVDIHFIVDMPPGLLSADLSTDCKY